MENNLNKFLQELIQEVETELDEATATGDAAGYNTPNAFSDGGSKDKKLKKKIATQLGMKIVGKMDEDLNEASFRPNSGTMSGGTYGLDGRKYKLNRDVKGVRIGDYTNVTLPKGTIIYNIPGGVFAHHDVLAAYQSGQTPYYNQSTFNGISIRREKNVILSIEKNSKLLESTITERQLKGLDGIDAKTPLTKITDTQKLKIIQSTGNIISFFVPKGFDRNFWQVISKGKIKKGKNLSGDVVYTLPGRMIGSPQFKSEKDLIAGVDWASVEQTRRFNESVNEAELKLGVKYVNKNGKEGFIQTGGSKNSQDWFWFDGKVKHPYDKVKKELTPSKDQKKTGFSDYLKQGGRVWDNVNKDGESINEAMKPSQIRSAISTVKKQLMKKWKQKGGYENFGQKELDQMKSKFDYNPYGSSDERQISKMLDGFDNWAMNYDGNMRESVNESKSQRPVNRWLELKNDETLHPHKKMAMGLKELKYQLAETQKFFNWYNKIKSMNELDSSDYWKRTQSHIYKIKERLINIAKTIQEIEK